MNNTESIKKAKAFVFNGPGIPMEMKSFEIPELKLGEILVKVEYVTVCGSDVHTYKGNRTTPCPTILGHEITGVIEKIKADVPLTDLQCNQLLVGSRVTWTIFNSDTDTYLASVGIPQKSTNLYKYGHQKIEGDSIFHGGMSQYCILKSNTGIMQLNTAIPLRTVTPINCAVATVMGAFRIGGRNYKKKNIVIVGAGMLGVVACAVARFLGAERIVAVDISKYKIDMAQVFGATKGLLNNSNTTYQMLKEVDQEHGIDFVFDFSGNPNAMEMGINVLRVGGTIVFIGATYPSRNLLIDGEDIVRRVLTIKGLHNYNYEDFKNAVSFINNTYNQYPFESLVEKEFDFKDANEAIEYAANNDVYRVGIKVLDNGE